MTTDAIDHEAGFVHLVEGGVAQYGGALADLGPEILAQAARIVGDQGVGGLQGGPGFFASLRRQGLAINLLAAAVVLLVVAAAVLLRRLFSLPADAALGILTGAVTNPPSLGAAQQALKDLAGPAAALRQAGLGYAVAYPFGVLGVILAMVAARRVFRVALAAENEAFQQAQATIFPTPESMNLEVKNPQLAGQPLSVLAGVIRQMLGRLNYQVDVRTSPIEAIEAFRANPGKFDLVFTDMAMPQMTGLKLAGKLAEIRADIPIILCTGFSDQANEERALAMGIRAVLLKPLAMRDIAEAVRNVLDEVRRQSKPGGGTPSGH